jgi:predicted Zn-dependent protease
MTDAHEINSTEKLSPLLERSAEFLGSDAEKAATDASDLLDIYPGQPLTLQLLLDALKLLGAEEGAQGLLEWMAQQHPNLAAISFRLGLLLGRLGKPKEAAQHLSRAVELEPNDSAAWLELGKQLSLTGDRAGSARALTKHLRLSLRELKLMDDVAEGSSAELTKADHMLHQAVAVNPTDPLVNQTLGKVMLRLGRLRDAEYFLKRALELAPGSPLIRHDYAMALNQQMDWQGADGQLDIILEQFPNDVRLQAVKAGNLIMVGKTEQGLRRLEQARMQAGEDAQFWLNYGHAMRTVGRVNEFAAVSTSACAASGSLAQSKKPKWPVLS